MAFPLIPVLLGTGALGALYLLTGQKPQGAEVEKPNTPTSQAGPPAMPAALRTAIDQLLTTPGVDPNQLDAFADKLDGYGFKAEAAQLHAKAAQLRAQKPAPPVPPPIPNIPSIPQVPIPPPPIPNVIPNVPIPNVLPIEPPQPAPQPPPPAPIAMEEWAVSTAPSGAYVRSMPSTNGSIVSQEMTFGTRAKVMRKDVPGDGTGGVPLWTQIQTPRGQQGYIAQNWVRFESTPVTSGRIGAVEKVTRPSRQQHARCAHPEGCRMRNAPTGEAKMIEVIPADAHVKLLGHVSGSKTTPLAPGPGGYLHVEYLGRKGFAPAEWFELTV